MATVIVQNPAPWSAEVTEGGSEMRVSYTCTRCHTRQGVNYQPLPWTDSNGDDLAVVATQLWCPNCERGVDIELTQE